jgi:hypothetical protein
MGRQWMKLDEAKAYLDRPRGWDEPSKHRPKTELLEEKLLGLLEAQPAEQTTTDDGMAAAINRNAGLGLSPEE